jgi:hypothetical protein
MPSQKDGSFTSDPGRMVSVEQESQVEDASGSIGDDEQEDDLLDQFDPGSLVKIEHEESIDPLPTGPNDRLRDGPGNSGEDEVENIQDHVLVDPRCIVERHQHNIDSMTTAYPYTEAGGVANSEQHNVFGTVPNVQGRSIPACTVMIKQEGEFNAPEQFSEPMLSDPECIVKVEQEDPFGSSAPDKV